MQLFSPMYTIIHRNEYHCKTSSVRSKLKRILFIGQWRDGYSLFQALGLWGKSEKAGERGKDERGRRRAKEREPVRISLTALCRYSRSCYTL